MERSILGRLLVLSLKVIYSPSRVAITAYGEAQFDTWRVILQLGAVAFEATRLVLIQILLTSKGISLNSITSLYYVAPCYFAFLCVPWIFVEYPILRETSSFHFDFAIFCSNSLCVFALNLAVFLLAHPPGASPSMSTRLEASASLDCFDCCVGGLLPLAMMLRLVLPDGKVLAKFLEGIMSILIWLIMPYFEVANVLVSHICWENNMPIAWKFLDKALVLKIVPPMLILALLLSSFLVFVFGLNLQFGLVLFVYFLGGFWRKVGNWVENFDLDS